MLLWLEQIIYLLKETYKKVGCIDHLLLLVIKIPFRSTYVRRDTQNILESCIFLLFISGNQKSLERRLRDHSICNHQMVEYLFNVWLATLPIDLLVLKGLLFMTFTFFQSLYDCTEASGRSGVCDKKLDTYMVLQLVLYGVLWQKWFWCLMLILGMGGKGMVTWEILQLISEDVSRELTCRHWWPPS